jgi:hypothetical protein
VSLLAMLVVAAIELQAGLERVLGGEDFVTVALWAEPVNFGAKTHFSLLMKSFRFRFDRREVAGVFGFVLSCEIDIDTGVGSVDASAADGGGVSIVASVIFMCIKDWRFDVLTV